MIRIKLETITPEKAKEYLKTNNGNRRLSMAQVESLAREIREDRGR